MASASALGTDIFESERENLMKQMLDAVKQCQVQFGGKQELATEKHSCVQCLLAQFERAFLHGLKRGKVWSAISSLSEPFRHVTSKVLAGIPESEITFWPFIKDFLSPSELQRYYSMSTIVTDSGRCRSWLRSCLNETSLERMLIAILADRKLISEHYDNCALLLDEERSSTLPVMARGIGSILFALDIENNQLNLPFKQHSLPRANAALAPLECKNRNGPGPVIADTGTEVGNPSVISTKKKRKKKVKQATIEDIEFPEDEPPSGIYLKPDSWNPIKHSQTEESTSGRMSGPMATKTEKVADNGKSVSDAQLLVEEMSSVKTHRRATSLESSEIIRQKKDRFKMALSNSIDFNVHSPGLIRNEAIKTDRQNQKPQNFKKPIEEQKTEGTDRAFDMQEEMDSKENPDYSNILSKLANISTSFKNSISTGFFQREHESRGDNRVDANEVQQEIVGHDNEDEYRDLLDNENDRIGRTSKLEMQQDVIDYSSNKEVVRRNECLVEDVISKKEFSRGQISSEKSGKIVQKVDTIMPLDSALEGTEDLVKLEAPCPLTADRYVEVQQKIELNAMTAAPSPAGLTSMPNHFEDKYVPGSDTSKSTHSSKVERVKETVDSNATSSSISNDKRRDLDKQDDIDQLSINSSNASSVYDESDTLQPVGFEGARFSSMFMSYDRQSSQAANDALRLLEAPVEIDFSQNGPHEREADYRYEHLSKHNANRRTADSSYGGDLSKDELKQVILVTVKRKDELQESHRVLQLALDEERELSLSLKSEVETLTEKLEELQETSNRRTTELSRENEVLRNQLKKYVNAVQLLKRENQNISKETTDAISTLRVYSDESEVILPPKLGERADSEMDSIYEEKLVQMAQLHGELMEFHEMLQRDLVRKEKIITEMKDELIILRGPLPDDIDDSNLDYERKVQEHRPLINVWIPSVFIQGKGSDAHHLYQIYIRIGDEEWNIYRRYSQFHKMHMLSSRVSQEVEKLSFPPKKILGKKDLKFVEGRRKKLQTYIRKLINIYLSIDRPLRESPNKENLELSLPFFSEEFCSDGKKKKDNNKKTSKRPTVYTGL